MSQPGLLSDELKQAVLTAGRDGRADIVTVFGPIYAPLDDDVVRSCVDRVRQKNLVVVIATRGGNPHVAYRIIRCFQRHYGLGTISVLIDSQCESAGTLIALGADEIIMSEAGYLGPLDTQIRKVDEVGEMGSALTADQALETLRQETARYVTDHFMKMRFSQEISMTTRQAADLASRLAIGLFEPIYAQIDPMRLGEINRSVRLASEYARRIARNVKKDAIATLVNEYPSHVFVIDREEAAQLFNVVRAPSQELVRLSGLLREEARHAIRAGKSSVRFLSHEAGPGADATPALGGSLPPAAHHVARKGQNGQSRLRNNVVHAEAQEANDSDTATPPVVKP